MLGPQQPLLLPLPDSMASEWEELHTYIETHLSQQEKLRMASQDFVFGIVNAYYRASEYRERVHPIAAVQFQRMWDQYQDSLRQLKNSVLAMEWDWPW